jgi:hypothetical protein
MTGQLVSWTGIPDYDQVTDGSGQGYRIGDNYVLTAGHIFFDWNKDTSPTLSDIVFGPAPSFLDYRGYQNAYLGAVLAAGSNPPSNAVIEGSIGPLGIAVTVHSNQPTWIHS